MPSYDDQHPRKICLWVRPGAYPRVEHLKIATLRKDNTLRENITIGWNGLPGKYSSLQGQKSYKKSFVNTPSYDAPYPM
jgi:hypothetical protein